MASPLVYESALMEHVDVPAVALEARAAPFTAKHIFNCSTHGGFAGRHGRPGNVFESKYLCSACRDCPTSCPACTGVTDTVAFVGDSLMFELASLARCIFRRPDWPVFNLGVVPHRRSLDSWLRNILASADVVVFNTGNWYNWDPTESVSHVKATSPDAASLQLDDCIRSAGAAASRTLSTG